MHVELAVHCWAGIHEGYAHLLRMQLHSLAAVKWTCGVSVAIAYNRRDTPVAEVVDSFDGRLTIRRVKQDEQKLLRRHIGRDYIAKSTSADVVWFTDCDHLFGAGAMEALAPVLARPKAIYFPRVVGIMKRKRTGDRMIAEKLLEPTRNHFVATEQEKAIGGLQIVAGDIARQYGYPVVTKEKPDAVLDRMTFGDGSYRIAMKREGVGTQSLDVPNVYRMRHSFQGY